MLLPPSHRSGRPRRPSRVDPSRPGRDLYRQERRQAEAGGARL